MAGFDLSDDCLPAFDFFPRDPHFSYASKLPWPLSHEQEVSQNAPAMMKRSTTPPQYHTQSFNQTVNHHSHGLMTDWDLSSAQAPVAHVPYPLETAAFPPQFVDNFGVPFPSNDNGYIPLQSHLNHNLHMGEPYISLGSQMEAVPFTLEQFQDDLFPTDLMTAQDLPNMIMPHQNITHQSLSDNYIEARSLTSSGSDNGWTTIENPQQSLDSSIRDPHIGVISNPSQTLHNRTLSESSYSDLDQRSRHSWSSFVDVPNAIGSPDSDSFPELDYYHDHSHHYGLHRERPSPPAITTTAIVKPIAIRKPSSSQKSPISTGRSSPPSKKPSRKNTGTKATKPIIRRSSQIAKNDTERRVGRRKGPLRPEQRKQASEIRKLGACLRCKFLKKTCDPGVPCAGCQPSHARLWLVPCTRIDIKDVAFFMKDFKADYERHVSLGFSVGNIKGFSDTERTLWITHGYGHCLPVQAREVFVRDKRCFGVDWIETIHEQPKEYHVDTARLTAGMEGVSTTLLSEYLDRHVDGGFEDFVDRYFDRTPFITDILKTAYRYWVKVKTPVVRKALKLVLAYNLTQHITMVSIPDEEGLAGKVEDRSSQVRGMTAAPVMISFQVKCAMADMWRELQKDILEELSVLYSSIYTKDKLKHWPTIFMVASILLAVWEEMQFDCHYRVPDAVVVKKFCEDMEHIPVGVIVGLFSAISQKLPPFSDWDTSQHHHLLDSEPAVCEALTEVREHVARHDSYLRSRTQTAFDRDDFDSLSNKFVSKLVIRAN